MKKIITASVNCLAALLLAGCLSAALAQRGFVKGTVTDAAGNPLAGVKIIVDHGIFYNSNLTTATGKDGNYRIKLPTGSWYAFAQLKRNYNGRTYEFYLEPDSYEGFGGEGATRNFVWKLTGEKREPLAAGFFGGTITIDKAIGAEIIEARGIEFTLKPVGALVDGSEGETLTIRSADGSKLEDIPVGRYDVSASYRGRAVALRRFNTDEEYVKTLRIDFEPKIAGYCDNCVKLEYKY